MTELLERLMSSLADPAAPLAEEDVAEAARLYPFFTLPAVEALRREGCVTDPQTRHMLMRRIALNAPDPASLFLSGSPEADRLREFYPPEQTTVTTDDAITKFLETYGSSDPAQDALLERLIFNPVPPDYTSLLEQEEGQVPATPSPGATSKNPGQDALIDAFLAGGPDEETIPPAEPLHEPEPVVHETPHKPVADDSLLSESLAKIYIRQKRYDKAFEIIHTLSLNNPKKSAYFADQLRFLAKLMLVKGHQNH